MSPQEIARQSKTVFETLLDSDEPRRLQLLAQLQPEVRQAVEDLLYQDQQSDFLNSSVWKSAPSPLPRLGPYQLVRELGRGGSSTVYLARRADGLFDRQVAIKVLHHPITSSEAGERFRRELRILSSLDHPGIVRFIEASVGEDGLGYIVTEFIDGLSIDKLARSLSIRQKVELLAQAAAALAAAHRANVIHRDLKPHNILVDAAGHIRIVDFGIALSLDSDSQLTQTGQGRMTLPYASPEQIQSGTVRSESSDIYSLGAVLYEILTGLRPFDSHSPHELIRSILEQDPVRPSVLDHAIPSDLDAICLKMMSKTPEDRYRSMMLLLQDLQAFLEGNPVQAARASWVRRSLRQVRKHRKPIFVYSVLAMAAVASIRLIQSERRRAEVNLQRAIRITRAAGLNASFSLARSSPQVMDGIVSTERSLRALLEANPNDVNLKWELTLQLNNYGTALAHPARHSVGNTGKAIEVLTEALKINEELRQSHPNEITILLHASGIECGLGSIWIEQGRYDKAQPLFESAVAKGVETKNETALDRDRSATYADALANLSRVYLQRRRAAECLRLRRESVRIRRDIVNADPKEISHQSMLAGALASYGWALREFDQPAEALKIYDEALQFALKGRDDSNLETVGRVARNYYELGRVHLALKHPAEARTNFTEGQKLFDYIAILEPGSHPNKRSMALSKSYLATLAPNRTEALRLARFALQIAEAAATQDLQNAKAAEELKEIRARVTPILEPGAKSPPGLRQR